MRHTQLMALLVPLWLIAAQVADSAVLEITFSGAALVHSIILAVLTYREARHG